MCNPFPKFDSFLCLGVYCLLLSLGAFTGGIWAGGGIALALLLYGAAWRNTGTLPRPYALLLGLAIVFLVGAAIHTATVSTDTALSWKQWTNLLTIFIPLSLLSSEAIQKRLFLPHFFTIAAVVAAIGALALGLELHSGGIVLHHLHGAEAQLTKYNRGFSYVVLLAFPLMAYLWHSRYRWWAAPFFLIMLFPTGLTESRSAKLALVAGMATMAAAYALPRLTRWGLSALSVLVIGWAFAARLAFDYFYEYLDKIPLSWRHRLEIWDYISYRIAEHPLWGWGLGTSRTLSIEGPHQAQYIVAKIAAMHPHNIMSELWVELGLFGVVMGVLFLQLTLRRAAALPTQLRPFALGAWVAAFTLTLCAYNFWADSLFAAFALTSLAFAGAQQKLQQV